jgi:hypothetical protein
MGRLGNESTSFKRAEITDKGIKLRDFEPRPYQKEMLEHAKKGNFFHDTYRLRQLTNQRAIGIDYGEKDGDKTVIATAKMNGHGITEIWFDEYANFPDYKWYRNPIKWWKWRRVLKGISRKRFKATWRN